MEPLPPPPFCVSNYQGLGQLEKSAPNQPTSGRTIVPQPPANLSLGPSTVRGALEVLIEACGTFRRCNTVSPCSGRRIFSVSIITVLSMAHLHYRFNIRRVHWTI